MGHLGVELAHVAPGEVDLEVAFHQGLTQQHGFFHAGVTATIADSAAGYAALSLFRARHRHSHHRVQDQPSGSGARRRLVARGRAIKAGRTLTVCRSDVFGDRDGEETLIATGLFTLMQLEGLDN
jgi:acyl-coenzyme A thioesterase PaaI-like protein